MNKIISCGAAAVIALCGLPCASPGAAASTSAPPLVCAVLVAPDAPNLVTAAAELTQNRLLQDSGLRLVERVALRQILEEQQFNLLFAAEGGAHRVRTGRLLGADVLILLRADARDRSTVELVVSETHGGLRLLADRARLTQSMQPTVEALSTLIAAALQKARQPIRAVFAIPPFVNRDLTLEHARLQTAAAQLLEQRLLNTPGLLVVEFSEAQALRREQETTGQPQGVVRVLPYYVLGEFSSGSGPTQDTLDVRLQIMRPAGSPLPLRFPGVTESNLAAVLHAGMQTALQSELQQAPAPYDPARELAHLRNRIQLHETLGNFRDAILLNDAAWLLDPAGIPTHVTAIQLGTRIEPPSKTHPREDAQYRQLWDESIRQWQSGVGSVEFLIRNEIFGRPSRQWAHPAAFYAALFRAQLEWLTPFFNDATLIANASGRLESTKAPIQSDLRSIRELCVHLCETRGATVLADTNVWVAIQPYLLRRDAHIFRDSLPDYCNMVRRVLLALQDSPIIQNIMSDLCRVRRIAVPSPAFSDLFDQIQALTNTTARAQLDGLRWARLQASDYHRQSWRVFYTAPYQPEAFLRRLDLPLPDEQPPLNTVFPTGWLPLDRGTDFIWERHERHALYLLGTNEKPWRVYQPDTHTFNEHRVFVGDGLYYPCFDGQYVWAPFVRPQALVVVLDPWTRRSWEITEKDGLPPMNRGAAAAPLGPGQALLVGAVENPGQGLRVWLARVSFAPGSGARVEVFHQAAERSGEPKTIRQAFRIGGALTLVPRNDPARPRVLIAHQELDHPLEGITHWLYCGSNEPLRLVKVRLDLTNEVLHVYDAQQNPAYCAASNLMGGAWTDLFQADLNAETLRFFPGYARVRDRIYHPAGATLAYWDMTQHSTRVLPLLWEARPVALYNGADRDSFRWRLVDRSDGSLLLLPILARNAREVYRIPEDIPPSNTPPAAATPKAVAPPALPDFVQPDYAAWARLATGMTPAEVRAQLGAPLRQAGFINGADDTNTWCYGYVCLPSETFPVAPAFNVFFSSGRVVKIEDPFGGVFSTNGLPTTPVLILPQDRTTSPPGILAVDVRWTPSSGQYPMCYEVEHRMADGAFWTSDQNHINRMMSSPKPYLAFTSVFVSPPLSFRVRAHNVLGASPWSESHQYHMRSGARR